MPDLDIIKLYEKTNKDNLETFKKEMDSKLQVQTEKKKTIKDTEWIEKMEETIPYIDNIFRSPNRFIVSNDEIVKIELAKKITVDSIKHLAKHTEMIQTVDDDTGDVIPAKILNANKEETFDTYENRLIYTLIQNCKMFIKKRKETISNEIEGEDKNNKDISYKAKTKIKDENIDIDMKLKSYKDIKGNTENKETEKLLERIENLSKKIDDVTLSSEVYKTIDKLHITLLKDPIKKTNVILKNTNFQYAMKLWEYLKDNYDEKVEKIDENNDYEDNGELKQLVDETFMLQYLAMKTLDEDEEENYETQNKIKEEAISQLIDKLLDMDIELTDEQLKELVANKYETIKYKKIEAIEEIQKIFRKHIDKYVKNVEKS